MKNPSNLREKLKEVDSDLLEAAGEIQQLREKYQRSQEKVKEYFDLLAAERETSEAHWQKWQDESKSHRHDIDYLNNQIQQLREQLADMELELQRANAKVAEKATQLAAAQAAQQPLVDALTWYALANHINPSDQQRAKTALAKVKEGK